MKNLNAELKRIAKNMQTILAMGESPSKTDTDLVKMVQQEYFPAIEWLLDEHDFRSTGRTYLMARAFVEIGLKHLGKPINFFDHVPISMTRKVMQRLVERLLKKDERVRDFQMNSKSFVITRRKDSNAKDSLP